MLCGPLSQPLQLFNQNRLCRFLNDLLVVFLFSNPDWELNVESGAHILSRFELNFPAKALDHRLAECKTKAWSTRIVCLSLTLIII